MITARKQNILRQFTKPQEINYLLAIIKSADKKPPLKYNFFAEHDTNFEETVFSLHIFKLKIPQPFCMNLQSTGKKKLLY